MAGKSWKIYTPAFIPAAERLSREEKERKRESERTKRQGDVCPFISNKNKRIKSVTLFLYV